MSKRRKSKRPKGPSSREETRFALSHLAQAGAVVALMGLLTYVVPAFHRFRPWVPDEPLPMSRLFQGWTEVPSFAGAGSAYQSGTGGAGGTESAEALGDDVAAALAEARATPTPPTSPTPAPGESDPPEGETARIAIAASEYEGVRIHIEDPSGRGMDPFYARLAETARQEAGAVSRITHYGDSTIATDHVTYTLRRRLQARFGDAGHGFVLTSRGFMPYRHRDLTHSFNGQWTIKEVTRAGIADGRYGAGGVQVQGRSGGRALFGTVGIGDDEPPDVAEFPVGRAVSRFRVFYQRHPRGAELRLTLDEGEPRTLSTTADEVLDTVEVIEVPDGAHQLELRNGGGGQLRTYGVSLERDGPGVIYDSMGLVGARAIRMLGFDQEHIAAQLRELGTNLLILGFGGNDASDNTGEERYYEQFKEVIVHMRAGREDLGCLIFAPLDQAERDDRGHIRTMRPLPRIVRAQRRAALELGCAFYDTFEAMGGAGAMQRWYRSRPRLAFGDFRHATPEGYEVIAGLFYKALLEGFAGYLERTQRP